MAGLFSVVSSFSSTRTGHGGIETKDETAEVGSRNFAGGAPVLSMTEYCIAGHFCVEFSCARIAIFF